MMKTNSDRFLTKSFLMLLVLAPICLGACGGSTDSTGASSDSSPPDNPPYTVEIDGWLVSVSTAPARVGPFAVESILRPSDQGPGAWIEHLLVVENVTQRNVRLHDIRAARLLSGRRHPTFVVADPGCGFERKKKRFIGPLCQPFAQWFDIPPSGTANMTSVLRTALRGMSPVAEGSYSFDRLFRFKFGGRPRSETIRVTYEVSPASVS